MSNNENKFKRYAAIFRALSNPNRLKIFFGLATCCKPGTIGIYDPDNTACVGDIGKDLDIPDLEVEHVLLHASYVATDQPRVEELHR